MVTILLQAIRDDHGLKPLSGSCDGKGSSLTGMEKERPPRTNLFDVTGSTDRARKWAFWSTEGEVLGLCAAHA